jgi:hypothetical protein
MIPKAVVFVAQDSFESLEGDLKIFGEFALHRTEGTSCPISSVNRKAKRLW